VRVSPEDFVRAWQESQSLSEVARKTGLSISTVSARAQTYRRKGVRLKPFPRRLYPPLDVAKLNNIIAEAGPEPRPPADPS
jgi:transposase